MERGISVALVPLTIAPFAAGSLNPILDATFIAALLVHSHIGFQSVFGAERDMELDTNNNQIHHHRLRTNQAPAKDQEAVLVRPQPGHRGSRHWLLRVRDQRRWIGRGCQESVDRIGLIRFIFLHTHVTNSIIRRRVGTHELPSRRTDQICSERITVRIHSHGYDCRSCAWPSS